RERLTRIPMPVAVAIGIRIAGSVGAAGRRRVVMAVAVDVGIRLTFAQQVDAAAHDHVTVDAVAGLTHTAEDDVIPHGDILFRARDHHAEAPVGALAPHAGGARA